MAGASILSLPDWCLAKILRYLDNQDIDALHTILPLKERLHHIVCLISDGPEPLHYQNISNLVSLDEAEYLASDGVSLAIIEVSDVELSLQKISQIPDQVNIRAAILTQGDHLTLSERTSFNKIQQICQSVTFPHVKKLKLDRQTLNTSVLELPSLEELELHSCVMSQKTRRTSFGLPMVHTITVTGTFESIHLALSYDDCPLLTELSLRAVDDMHALGNLKSDTLKTLTISDRSNIDALVNVYLPSLTELHMEQVGLLHNCQFAALRKIHLHSDEAIGIESFSAPNLREFEMVSAGVSSFRDVEISHVDRLCITDEESYSPENHPFKNPGLLRALSDLLSTPNEEAEAQEITIPLHSVGDETEELKCIIPHGLMELEVFGVRFVFEKYGQRKMITGMEIHAPTQLKDLEGAKQLFVNLKGLMIHDFRSDHFESLFLHDLEELYITPGANQKQIFVRKCTMSSLTTLSINSGLPDAAPLNRVTISDISFPEITAFSPSVAATKTLSLVKLDFPKLKVFTPHFGHVGDLILYNIDMPAVTRFLLSCPFDTIDIGETRFPKLQIFSLGSKTGPISHVKDFSISAPSLKRLEFFNTKSETFKADTYPRLKTLKPPTGLNTLTLGDCEALTLLDIEGNDELRRIEHGSINKLHVIKCSEKTPFFPDLDDAGHDLIKSTLRETPKKSRTADEVNIGTEKLDKKSDKRGRGRPRKIKSEAELLEEAQKVKRPRGRPRKVVGTEGETKVKRPRRRPRKVVGTEGETKVKRPRGRPRKVVGTEGETKVKRPRGRPRKHPAPNAEIGADTEIVKRSRGRPRKVPVVDVADEEQNEMKTKRPRGRPPKVARPEVVIEVEDEGKVSTKRPRGRPPKRAISQPFAVDLEQSEGSVKRQRGRPRKVPGPDLGGEVRKEVETKRPRGRPPKATKVLEVPLV